MSTYSSNHPSDLVNLMAPLAEDSAQAELRTALMASYRELDRVYTRLETLEREVKNLPYRRGVPDSALFDDSFLKRAFAVFGHFLVAYLTIAVPIGILVALGG